MMGSNFVDTPAGSTVDGALRVLDLVRNAAEYEKRLKAFAEAEARAKQAAADARKKSVDVQHQTEALIVKETAVLEYEEKLEGVKARLDERAAELDEKEQRLEAERAEARRAKDRLDAAAKALGA